MGIDNATFAVWLRPTSYGTLRSSPAGYTFNISPVLRKGTHFDIEGGGHPGSVRATLRANGVPAQQNSVKLNQWQHFVVVLSGGTVTFYKNGFRLADPGSSLFQWKDNVLL